MVSVHRTHHEIASHGGLTTLVQHFRFEGASASEVAGVLATAPLVGPDSVFGDRPGSDGGPGSARRLTGFSPVPGFRFDVHMVELEPGVLRVRFSQPERAAPYLDGDLLWSVVDVDGGCVLEEEINTTPALERVEAPLTGSHRSPRRWLFFRVGHAAVMRTATENMAALLSVRR